MFNVQSRSFKILFSQTIGKNTLNNVDFKSGRTWLTVKANVHVTGQIIIKRLGREKMIRRERGWVDAGELL